MKKILALVCCLALMLSMSLFSVPAFAAEESRTYTTTPEVPTRAQGLWYKDGLMIFGSYNATVTPTKGTNLNLWLKCDGPVKVTVYYTNALGGYTQTYQNTFQKGERDVRVVTNCNGKQTLVKFETYGTTISALLYQN